MRIIIYTKSNCPNCVNAKQLLKSNRLEYDERDVGIPEWRDSLTRNAPDARQMPAIWIDGQYVGGFAGLQSALKQLGLA
jgi:glutaredoxin 3